jgi:hypothetical protein
MKRLLITLTILCSFAFGFEKVGKVGDMDIKLSSTKDITVGENSINITLSKDKEIIKGAKINFKIFMPEMPGMPYMEDKSEAIALKSGEYQVKFNSSMGGTWQIRIIIELDDKKYRYKSSLII